MKLVTPLDNDSLRRVPIALEGKFYLGGPYEFIELLREPEQYGDEHVDWRDIHVVEANGVTRPARIEIASGLCRMNPCVWPSQPARITQKLRYLYREVTNQAIEGAVTLEVSYVIPGVRRQFSVKSDKVIHCVYVHESRRGRGIARVLLSEVLSDAPDATVHPHFSKDGAKLFGFDEQGRRIRAF